MKPFLRKPLHPHVLLTLTKRSEERIGFAWHYHHEIELAYLASSRGLRLCGDSIEAYEPGDVALFAPGVPHSFSSDPQAPRPHVQVVAHFGASDFWEALGAPELAPMSDLLRDARRGVVFSGTGRARAARLLERAVAAKGLLRVARFLEALDVLATDAERRCLSSTPFEPPRIHASNEPIERALKYLEENLGRPVSVPELASRLGMSRSTFQRFFRNATGRTMVPFLNELRLRRTVQLLVETDRSIEQIAVATGFGSGSYLHRCFVAWRKVTPTELRRQLRAQLHGERTS